jgi:hypothetical protein
MTHKEIWYSKTENKNKLSKQKKCKKYPILTNNKIFRVSECKKVKYEPRRIRMSLYSYQ